MKLEGPVDKESNGFRPPGRVAYISLWQILCFYANKNKNQTRKYVRMKT